MNLLQRVVIHIIKSVEMNMKESRGKQILGNVMYVMKNKPNFFKDVNLEQKKKDFEIDVLVIENQNQENKTFFNDPMYIVREHLYKFLQFGKFVLLHLLL